MFFGAMSDATSGVTAERTLFERFPTRTGSLQLCAPNAQAWSLARRPTCGPRTALSRGDRRSGCARLRMLNSGLKSSLIREGRHEVPQGFN
eukprot:357847-Chlamydomonas_euryale.AAC.4